jgi:hypothetical protein
MLMLVHPQLGGSNVSETTTTTIPEGSVPAEGATVPEGCVPAAQVEEAREEARRRYQSENDRLKVELARLQSGGAGKPAGTPEGESKGFDPDAFRATLLRDVSGVLTLSQSAATLRAEFPHADPAIFTPDGLTQFSTPEALRFAVEDSHRRVAVILDAEKAKLREELVAEIAQKYPEAGAGAGAGGVSGQVGDPTPQQLAEMPLDEFNKLEPAVIERVLAGAK